MNLVIFVEEDSMKATLEILLPKIGTDGHHVQIISHQGKTDLETSWRKKLPAWNIPNTKFLILRDADGGDCSQLKQDLLQVATDCGKEDAVKIRIVCQELEAWFLGDKQALENAGYTISRRSAANFRAPDKVLKPSNTLAQWKKCRQKISGARARLQPIWILQTIHHPVSIK